MATTVDTLLVRIEADMSDLKRQLKRVERDVNKSTAGIAAAFKKMGPTIGVVVGAIVVRKLGQMGMAAINLAGDVEEMQAKSSVVFGQFRDQVVSDLDEFGDSVGRSTHKLEEMASSVQDTFVPMGFARGEAAKLSVELTKLAVDTASFNNASDVDTMRAFQSAIVGNHETVRRFGVVITEATLQQELYRMGINKSSKEVTNAEKVQARLNLITAGLGDAQGDAARTADSFTNQTKALKDEFFDLSVEIGQELIPVALQLVEVFREGIGATRAFLIAIGFLDEFGNDLAGVSAELKKARIELKKLEEDSANSTTGGRTRKNFRDNINRQKALIKTLEEEKEELQLIADIEKALASVPDKPTGGAATIAQDVRAELEKNAILREQVRMQIQLNQATSSGDKTAIQRAKQRIAEFPAMKRSIGFVESLTEKEEKLMLTTSKFSGIENGVVVVSGQLGLELERLGEEYNKLGDEVEDINPLFDAQLTAIHSLAQGMSDAFADMFMNGKFNLESLKDVFRSFVRTMIAKAIELFVVNRILGMIFPSAFTSIGSGAFIPTLASGGAVHGKQPYVVGERGPELFVPHSAGSIMNSNNTRSAMGGSGGATVVQNINVTTGIQQTVRNEIRSMMPEIAANAKNAVADTKRRGGGFGRAFA